MAYDGSNPSWDIVMYDDIADAMKRLRLKKLEHNSLREATWNIDNIADWERPMEDAMNNYIDVRKKRTRNPFIDDYHF